MFESLFTSCLGHLDIQAAALPTHLSSFSVICSIFSWQLGGSKMMMFTVSNYLLSVIKMLKFDLHAHVCGLYVNSMREWSNCALRVCTHVTSHILRDNTTYMSLSRDPLLSRKRDPAALCGRDCGATVVELLTNLCKKWDIEGGRTCLLVFHAAGCFFESFPRNCRVAAIFSTVHLNRWVTSTSAWLLRWMWPLVAPLF